MGLDQFKQDLQRRSTKGRGFKVGPLFLAIVAQGLILGIAVLVVVVVPAFKEEPEFSSKKTIYLPQRELEHSVAVTEFQQVASPPILMDRLTTTALLPDDMPSLPELPQTDFKPIDTDNPLHDTSALLSQSGLVSALQGLNTESSRISFFGIEDDVNRVVIAFDISTTVTNSVVDAGLTMQDIKNEAASLVKKLNGNTLFGFVQFARNYDVFRDYMVPGTRDNKDAALTWLDKEFRTSGSGAGWDRYNGMNGIEAVMNVAFNMQPDVIIVLSDASFWRGPPPTNGERVPWDDLDDTIKQLQEGSSADVRIHFVGFGVEDPDAKGMKKIVRRYDGKYRDFK